MGWLEYPKGCDIPDKERFAIRDLFDKDFTTRSEAQLAKKFLKIAQKREKKNNNLGRVDGLFEIKIREYEKNNPYDTDNRDRFEFVIMRVLEADDAKALR